MKPMFRILALVLSLQLISFGENIVFPEESGIVDVKRDYGAIGDGVTDDTDALQRAIFENKGKLNTVYFPNGTYLVSRTLFVGGEEFSREQIKSKKHSRDRFISFQGQSMKGTVIRLKDNTPAFSDRNNPRTLFSTYDGDNTGDVMHTYVRNMTFDVGVGNPGAAGLRYISNNTGAIFDVTIRSSDPKGAGALGLDLLQSQQGPSLIRDVRIEGFDVGIAMDNTFSLVFENIELMQQNKVGIQMKFGRATVRKLKSNNNVPVVITSKHDHFAMIDSDLTGGSPDSVAIVAKGPKIFLRDIKQEGYRAIVSYDGQENTAKTIKEWTPNLVRVFNEKPSSLNLPIKETPKIPWEEDLSKWVVLDHGAEDDTASVQAAIDAGVERGATTVCFVFGGDKYLISDQIRFHGTINRVIGMESMIDIRDPEGKFAKGLPVFDFGKIKGGKVIIERFFGIGGWDCPKGLPMLGNSGANTMIVQGVAFNGAIKGRGGPKTDWFLDDVVQDRKATLPVSKGERIWARQFNSESADTVMVDMDGGKIWLLGLKTEGRATHLRARNGAQAEFIGGVSYQSWGGQKKDPPMFDIEDSKVSVSLGVYASRNPFTTVIREKYRGSERILEAKELPFGNIGLYRTAK